MGSRARRLSVGVAAVVAAATAALGGAVPATSAPAGNVTAAARSGVAAETGTRACGTSWSFVNRDGVAGDGSIGFEDPSDGFWTVRYAFGRTGTTALGDATTWSTDSWEYRRFLVVRKGTLWSVVGRFPRSGDSSDTTSASTSLMTGWSGVTDLVDVSVGLESARRSGWLYTLDADRGRLARYRVSEPTFGDVSVRRDAARTGYTFRHIALAFVLERPGRPTSDVLLGTTAGGRLYLVEVPRTTTFRPRLVQVRSSGWAVDDLATDQCDDNNSHQTIIAVRGGGTRGHAYHLGAVDLATGRADITYRGVLEGRWDMPEIASTSSFGFYPERWVKSGTLLP